MAKGKEKIETASDVLKVPGPEEGSRSKYVLYSVAGVLCLYLAVWATGARVWQFKMTRKGVPYFLTLGSLAEITLNAAIQTAREYRRLILNGIDPRQLRALNEPMTLRQFVEEYFWPYVESHYKSYKNVRNMLDKRILPAFGHLPMNQIPKLLIREFCQQILGEVDRRTGRTVGRATVNRTLSLLSSIFKYALELDFIEINPCVGVRREKENPSRDRYLLTDERSRFFRAALTLIDRPQTKAILILASLGLRPAEVLGLLWSDVHLADNQIYVRDPKNGESRFVALNSIASDLFRQLLGERTGQSKWVFPSRSKLGHLLSVRRTFASICRKAEINGLENRDLRRSHATLLLQSGVDLFTIKEVLGHRSLKSTTAYARVSSAAMAEANELAATKFKEAINV